MNKNTATSIQYHPSDVILFSTEKAAANCAYWLTHSCKSFVLEIRLPADRVLAAEMLEPVHLHIFWFSDVDFSISSVFSVMFLVTAVITLNFTS